MSRGLSADHPPRGGHHGRAELLMAGSLDESLPTLLSDINMLVLTGGRERTNNEYAELLSAAGLSLASVLPLAAPYGLITARPA